MSSPPGIVLWNPHFDVRFNGTRCGGGYSTFLRWRDFLPEEFARRPDLAFVIRPHPLFFSSMEDRGVLTLEQIEDFRRRCAAAGNIRIDRSPSYPPVLAAANAMISDLSSLIIEFGVSGKPICHLHNPQGPLAQLHYEIDLDWIREHCLWATEETQVRSFLDRVARGEEPVCDQRAADLRRRMGVRLDGVGAAIKRAVDERLAAEQEAPAAGRTPAQRIAV